VVCNTTSDRLQEIAAVHDELADACDRLAERIDHLHAEVVDELRSLVEWSAAIEGAGAVLSLFTFGIAEAPAQVAEGVRIARTATFVAGCVERFLSAAESLAAGIRAIADEAGAVAARLGRLLEIPLAEPALAGVGSMRVLRDAPEIQAVVRMERSADAPILTSSEQLGGHTIARHIALTDEQLIARNLPEASTFTDLANAERLTSQNLGRHRTEIGSWLSGSEPTLVLQSPVGPSAGRIYVRATRSFESARRIRTVLVRTRTAFYVKTSYLAR
jgi:hypothetical protein